MIEFTAKTRPTTQTVFATLTLPFELRQKSRQRVVLDNGEEAALLLKRGTVLYHDDHLISEENKVIQIKAAVERLSVVECDDPLMFARACYHLGNRHVSIQIEQGRLFYVQDHVLDTMLRGLRLKIKLVSEPFEPEPGAYGGHAKGLEYGHHHGH